MFSYLFNRAPGQSFEFYIHILILAGILIIGGIVFGFIYEKKKKNDFAFKRLFKKVTRTSVLMGVLFLFLLLVRYENIPYFSMRFWIYLALLLLLFFVYRYIKIWRKNYPLEKENIEIRRVVSSKKSQQPQYLPNKKKKS